jgi:hypothetical protein
MSRMALSQGDFEIWCHICQDHALSLHVNDGPHLLKGLHADEDGNLVGVDGVEAQHHTSFSKSLRNQHVGLGELDATVAKAKGFVH